MKKQRQICALNMQIYALSKNKSQAINCLVRDISYFVLMLEFIDTYIHKYVIFFSVLKNITNCSRF